MDTELYRSDAAPSSAEGICGSEPNDTPAAESVVAPIQAAADVPAALCDHVRYRVLKKLGEGGMGAVYLAEHKLMQRPVALKVIRADLTAQPQLVQRFQREMQAAARLDHPNIVRAYDAEQAGNCHFLVMEYVEGTDLARLVKEHGPLSVGAACDCIRQAALGLQHAHEHQLIHRDLKPQNLMRTAEGQVKILDFGLARAVQGAWEEAGDRTASGVILGTPDYMAPEQADDARQVDIRADIYSLGCTLYHLLGGRVPFPGRSAVGKLARHAWEQPTPLAELQPQLPPELVRIVARMMAKDSSARYQTPAEVAAALQPWCGYQPETIALPKPRRMSVRRLLRPGWLIAAVLLLAAGATAAYVLHARKAGGQDPEPRTDPAAVADPRPTDRTPFDLSGTELLIDDDFSGTAKLPFFPPGKKAEEFFQQRRAIVTLQDQRLVLSLNPLQSSPRFTSCAPLVECANFVCEVRARALGKGDAGWAIYHDDGSETSIWLWVMVRLDGQVEVNESDKTGFRHKLGSFRAPPASSTDGFTTLRVERRGQALDVFVNGVAVSDPIRLERHYGTGHQYIAVWGRGTGDAKTEFTRYRLWSLP